MITSFRENSSSDTRSIHILGLKFRRSTVSYAKVLAVSPCLTATIWVLSVKTLNVTGSTYSPESFFANTSLIKVCLLQRLPIDRVRVMLHEPSYYVLVIEYEAICGADWSTEGLKTQGTEGEG